MEFNKQNKTINRLCLLTKMLTTIVNLLIIVIFTIVCDINKILITV